VADTVAPTIDEILQLVDRIIDYLDWTDAEDWPANELRSEWRRYRTETRDELMRQRDNLCRVGTRMGVTTRREIHAAFLKRADRIAAAVNALIVDSPRVRMKVGGVAAPSNVATDVICVQPDGKAGKFRADGKFIVYEQREM